MIFSTSTNTNILPPLPSSSSSALLLQTVARICRDRLVQITAVCLNTLWLGRREKEKKNKKNNKQTFWTTKTAVQNLSLKSLAFNNIKAIRQFIASNHQRDTFLSSFLSKNIVFNNHAAWVGAVQAFSLLASLKHWKKSPCYHDEIFCSM